MLNQHVFSCIAFPAFHDLKTKVTKEKCPKYNCTELEVTDEALESEQSIVFDEAENKMHTIKVLSLRLYFKLMNYEL